MKIIKYHSNKKQKRHTLFRWWRENQHFHIFVESRLEDSGSIQWALRSFINFIQEVPSLIKIHFYFCFRPYGEVGEKAYPCVALEKLR